MSLSPEGQKAIKRMRSLANRLSGTYSLPAEAATVRQLLNTFQAELCDHSEGGTYKEGTFTCECCEAELPPPCALDGFLRALPALAPDQRLVFKNPKDPDDPRNGTVYGNVKSHPIGVEHRFYPEHSWICSCGRKADPADVDLDGRWEVNTCHEGT